MVLCPHLLQAVQVHARGPLAAEGHRLPQGHQGAGQGPEGGLGQQAWKGSGAWGSASRWTSSWSRHYPLLGPPLSPHPPGTLTLLPSAGWAQRTEPPGTGTHRSDPASRAPGTALRREERPNWESAHPTSACWAGHSDICPHSLCLHNFFSKTYMHLI